MTGSCSVIGSTDIVLEILPEVIPSPATGETSAAGAGGPTQIVTACHVWPASWVIRSVLRGVPGPS